MASQRREVLNKESDVTLATLQLESAKKILEDLEFRLQQARKRGL